MALGDYDLHSDVDMINDAWAQTLKDESSDDENEDNVSSRYWSETPPVAKHPAIELIMRLLDLLDQILGILGLRPILWKRFSNIFVMTL